LIVFQLGEIVCVWQFAETRYYCVLGSQTDLEYPSTIAEKDRLLDSRERVQSDAGGVVPMLSVMYLQMQLLQNVQESLKV